MNDARRTQGRCQDWQEDRLHRCRIWRCAGGLNGQGQAPLHFLCGKMAAGKSTLSKSLAAQQNAVLICEDIWLSRLYPDEVSTFDDYLKYSARLKDILKPHLLDLLRQGTCVILDFPANVPRQRQWFREIADAAGAVHVLHYVDTPDVVCKAQRQKRNREKPDGSMVMSEAEFDRMTSFFVPPADAELFNIVRYAQP